MASLVYTLVLFSGLFYLTSATYSVVKVGKLDKKRSQTAAIFDGKGGVYIMGGSTRDHNTTFYDNILQFNINTDQIYHVGRFETKIRPGALATDGGKTFYFVEPASQSHKIYEFVGSGSSIQPKPVAIVQDYKASVAYDGNGLVYVVTEGYYEKTRIFHFNTSDYGLEVVAQDVLFLTTIESVWIGDSFYVFSAISTVYKFTPATGKLETLGRIDLAAAGYAVVAVGTDVYFVGGYTAQSRFQFSKYDTIKGIFTHLEVENYTRELFDASAVYVPETNRIYVFGGRHELYGDYDEIFYIQL